MKTAGVFENVFVPVNPGNAGLAIGNALLANGVAPRAITPFLGPVFDSEEIKATLDNCKLIYEWVGEHTAAARAVDALSRGSLVGWYHGPMESGPRALGARCDLASPFAPYLLENLNHFLKQREPWRGYALSGRDSRTSTSVWTGYGRSPFMECDFRASRSGAVPTRQAEIHESTIRVQTVNGADAPPGSGAASSLRPGHREVPCSSTRRSTASPNRSCAAPRRHQGSYGTGLDMLVMNDFVITK